MATLKGLTKSLFGFLTTPNRVPNPPTDNPAPITKEVIVTPPAGSPSIQHDEDEYTYSILSTGKHIAKPAFAIECIPLIRHLSKYNPDLGQAVFDLVMLSNTGIEIQFDQGVSEDKALEMRRYITRKAASWHEGCAGLPGLISKMFYQLWIAGAISNEWVPSKDVKEISRVTFLNPEKVVWVKENGVYNAYQKVSTLSPTSKDLNLDLHRLNKYTFKYYAFTGDSDIPYGIPPMLNALSAIKTQGSMLDNISFITDLMGLLGYVDAKIEKPEQEDGESSADYRNRLASFLTEFKTRIRAGIRDGVNVGYKDDHEFNFNSTTRDTGGIESIWELNEQQISSGLKFDSAFLGRSYNSSETSITILFTKMLSTLTNAQSLVAENLQYGFTLALLMQGYKFESLKVKFNKSTVTDTLKYQQAEEYKIRNNRQLRMDGIIDQTTYATNMGYDKPASPEPVVPFDAKSAYDEVDAKRKAKDDRQEADKKTRDKKNPQGTIKKQK